ncbi:hypothetical protein R9C00_25380 [Flammeovirgaceae bacterium SG7u.111]|nr:hypothetical protein [Flammeovirgaceae bacterium SG7u.132]WPO35029.1 hypothetical protein R9C00_25380 [Flammeovirgaceae bacterium SG7u.111]
MKQAFSILIIVGMMLQTVRSAGVLINYQLNKAYYAEVLCDNKDKPELQCNGMCHVVEELGDVEEQVPVTPSVPEFEFKPIVFGDINTYAFKSRVIYEIDLEGFERAVETKLFHTDFFRPPQSLFFL